MERAHSLVREQEACFKRIRDAEAKILDAAEATIASLAKQLKDASTSNDTNPPWYKQSKRAPHPAPFSGNPCSDKTEWQDFKLHMRFKMQLDGHFYPTANDRLLYVMSRLKSGALRRVRSFYKDDGTVRVPDKPHADWTDLLEILENAVDEQNYW
ncbi:hypothetical protein BKA81DRAFT_434541 [Phyllosticta paracitricarpa]